MSRTNQNLQNSLFESTPVQIGLTRYPVQLIMQNGYQKDALVQLITSELLKRIKGEFLDRKTCRNLSAR